MAIIAKLLVALVAVLHIYIMLLEVFWWDKPRGKGRSISQQILLPN